MRLSLSPNARSGRYETNVQPGPRGKRELYPLLDAELDQAGTFKVFPTASGSDQQRPRLTESANSANMKRCPQCNRSETDEILAFCRLDGTALVNRGQSIFGPWPERQSVCGVEQ